MNVRKAVIPAAGFGTRFLPASKSVPKNMLPIFDTPGIHYVVEEAVHAGIDQIVIVTSHGQEVIDSYFGKTPDLERALKRQGNETLLSHMLDISEMAQISYVHQHQQLGLGHAILTARDFVGDEPFAVFLPDDIIWNDCPTIGNMTEIFEELGGSVIAVKEVPDKLIPALGVVEPKPIDGNVCEVIRVIEKPSLDKAPSNLAIIGRYVLTPQIFEMLDRTSPGAIGEIQITDAIDLLLQTQKVYAYRFPGAHLDVGSPLGLLKASVHVALQRKEIAAELREWLASIT